MKPRRSFWSAALFLSLIAPSAQAAGFERATVAAAQPIDIGIWYPSDDPPPDEFNTRFRQAVAIGGEPTGEGLPLVVLSHGYGGWMGGHADTALALAEAGFVAVAPTHPGSNYEDKGPASEYMVSRPRHISSVIDFMLEEWGHSRRLAPGQIGVFGFSAGGYTALVAAGATPDIALAIEHCAGNPAEFLCRIGLMVEVAASSLRTGDAAFSSDPRIRAISIAAPGLGFAFGLGWPTSRYRSRFGRDHWMTEFRMRRMSHRSSNGFPGRLKCTWSIRRGTLPFLHPAIRRPKTPIRVSGT